MGIFILKLIVGKFAAAILMFLGIGLIGYLTSTITNYFTNDMEQKEKSLEARTNFKNRITRKKNRFTCQ